jgi:hypothetical protein
VRDDNAMHGKAGKREMFFGFQLMCGMMMVFYGYSVMKNPRIWGDQGRRTIKPENFDEYCRQNGMFFLKAGCLMALIGALDALVTLDGLLYVLLYVFGLCFAFLPLSRWCKANEGFSWPWKHAESEKKRIRRLRQEQERQEQQETSSANDPAEK